MKFKLIETFLIEGKNIDKTWEQYKDKIIDLIKSKDIFKNDVDEDKYRQYWIETIISCDPTYQEGTNTTGDYGVWLTNMWLKTGKRLEKDYARALLTEFKSKQPNLKQRDINQYSSYEELETALKETSLSKKQLQRQRQNIKNISPDDLIFQGEEWSVFSPSTYESSCALRKGASWCTGATDSDYHYNQYTRVGKLYIIINNTNPTKKYQAYIINGKHTVKEFRDSKNRSVSFHKFMDENPELQQCFYDNGIVNPVTDGVSEDMKINVLSQYFDVPIGAIQYRGNDEYLVGVDEEDEDEGDCYYILLVLLVLAEDEVYERAVDYEETDLRYYIEDLAYTDEEYEDSLIRYILNNVNQDDTNIFVANDIYNCYLKGDFFEKSAVEMGDEVGIIAPDFGEPKEGQLARDKFFDEDTNKELDYPDKSSFMRLCRELSYRLEGFNSGLDYLKAIWGDDTSVVTALVKQNLVNWRGVAEDSVENSGALEILSNAYDSQIIDLGNGYVAFESWW